MSSSGMFSTWVNQMTQPQLSTAVEALKASRLKESHLFGVKLDVPV